jgi:hypothetical protein
VDGSSAKDTVGVKTTRTTNPRDKTRYPSNLRFIAPLVHFLLERRMNLGSLFCNARELGAGAISIILE